MVENELSKYLLTNFLVVNDEHELNLELEPLSYLSHKLSNPRLPNLSNFFGKYGEEFYKECEEHANGYSFILLKSGNSYFERRELSYETLAGLYYSLASIEAPTLKKEILTYLANNIEVVKKLLLLTNKRLKEENNLYRLLGKPISQH